MRCHLPGAVKNRDTECLDKLSIEVKILLSTPLVDEQNHFLHSYTHSI